MNVLDLEKYLEEKNMELETESATCGSKVLSRESPLVIEDFGIINIQTGKRQYALSTRLQIPRVPK